MFAAILGLFTFTPLKSWERADEKREDQQRKTQSTTRRRRRTWKIKSRIFYEWIKWRSVTIKITISNHTTWIMTIEMLCVWLQDVRRKSESTQAQANHGHWARRQEFLSFVSATASSFSQISRRTQRVEEHTNDHKKKILLIVVISKINSIFFPPVSWGEPNTRISWNRWHKRRVKSFKYNFWIYSRWDHIYFILLRLVEFHVVGLGHTICFCCKMAVSPLDESRSCTVPVPDMHSNVMFAIST